MPYGIVIISAVGVSRKATESSKGYYVAVRATVRCAVVCKADVANDSVSSSNPVPVTMSKKAKPALTLIGRCRISGVNSISHFVVPKTANSLPRRGCKVTVVSEIVASPISSAIVCFSPISRRGCGTHGTVLNRPKHDGKANGYSANFCESRLVALTQTTI